MSSRFATHHVMIPRSIAYFSPRNGTTDIDFLLSSSTPAEQQQQRTQQSSSIHDTAQTKRNRSINRRRKRPAPGSLHDFFFGFMYEDEEVIPGGGGNDGRIVAQEYQEHDNENDEDENRRPIVYGTLCLQLFLQSSATATAMALVPIISRHHQQQQQYHGNDNHSASTQFVARMTSSAVLGCALGKLFLGPLPDVIGARTASLYFSIALSVALLFLMHERTAIIAAFLVEFCSAVQWPCVVIILANHRQLDQGVFWASLASRVGTVCGHVMMTSGRWWRWMAVMASWWAAISASIIYHYSRDAPDAIDRPNNPVDPIVLRTWFPEEYKRVRPWSFCKLLRLAVFVMQRNIYPSIRHIIHSGAFWTLAIAHTGASLVKTSERVLDTMNNSTTRGGTNDGNNNSLAVWHGVGTLLGLLIAGPIFASQADDMRARKWMVSRLYGMAVLACYGLAATFWWGGTTTSASSSSVDDNDELIAAFQGICILLASFGMAVPFYHIPSLVGASYSEKGLFLAYTDGVAYATASFIWKLVGYTSGWSYAWAMVALWVLVSGIVMHEFLEHYFCRPNRGNYETILLA
jgi:hypothetical protein